MLEIIADDMSSSLYNFPKPAIPSPQLNPPLTYTPTTLTLVPQSSATSTAVNSSVTPITTLQAYPAPSTPTIDSSFPTFTISVNDIGATNTPLELNVTATLIPVPTITLEFPPTDESNQIDLSVSDSPNIIERSDTVPGIKLFSSQIPSIIGLLFIWLIFVGLLVYFLRWMK
jgi:hypothetical protein